MATMKNMLRNRALLTLGFSESVSGVGNWITMMAVFAMVVFKGDGSVAQSSGIFIAGLLPTLLVSPVAGWVLDRVDRRLVMIVSELVSGAMVVGLIFTDNLALIYTMLALQAVSISFMTPARNAVIPDLVGRDELTRANAFLQQLSGIIKIGAPMLAGALLSVMSPHQAIILDVISFIFSALILSRLPALKPHREAPQTTETGAPAPAAGWWLTLRGIPRLQVLFAVLFTGILVIVGFDVLAPVYIRDVLVGTEKTYGLLVGLVGAGTLGASLVLVLQKKAPNPWRDVIAGVALLAVIPAAMAAAGRMPTRETALWVTYAGSLIGGYGNGLLSIQVGTLLQTLTPPALLGRMAGALQSSAVGGQMAGILLTPLLVPGLIPAEVFFTGSMALLLVLSVVAVGALRRTAGHAPSLQTTLGGTNGD